MTPTAKAVYRIENIEIDPSQCRVTFAGEERHLRRQAFHVLLYLLEQRHRTIGREELIENVWHGAAVTDDSLGQCISEIRKALGDDSQHSRFIKTVPKVGYRFIGLVEEGLRSPSAAQPAPQTKAVPEPKDAFSAHAAPPAESHELTVSSTPGWSRRRLAALLLVVASLGTFFLLRHFRVPAEFETGATSAILANPRRSVAVLGFKNLSGSSEDAWLSTALSDWLSTELAAGEQLRMVPPESVSRVRNELVLANLDSLSKADLDRVGKNLGVDLVLVGSYARLGKASDDPVRLDLRLEDTRSGDLVGAVSETGSELRLFDLVSKAGEHLRAKLRVQPLTGQEAEEVAATLPSSRAAARLYAEGIDKLAAFDALAARELFHKAVAAAPEFALAHSALSTAWSRLGYDASAVEEAKKASELSSKLPRAERLLIQGRYDEVSKNWQKAIEVYRALFEFFPDSIDYGLNLAHSQIHGGNGKNALETVAILHNLPPPLGNDPRVDLAEADAAGSQGDLKRALASADRAVEKARGMGASLLLAHALTIRASVLPGLGRLPEAVVAADEAERIFRAAGDKDDFARSQARTAGFLDSQGDFAAAKKMYETSLATFREIGDRERIAAELNNIATELQNLGDLKASRNNFEEALAGWSEVRHQQGVAVAKANVAEILFDLGDVRGAQQMYEQSIKLCRESGNENLAAFAFSGLGRVLQAQGKLNEAWEGEKRSVSTFEGEGRPRADAYVPLADLLLDLGKAEDAAATARKALESKVPDRYRWEADAVLARALLAQGRIADATKVSDEASAALGNKNSRESKLIVATTAAIVLAASGNPAARTEAARSLHQIVTDAKRIGFVPEELEARLALGEVEIASGDAAVGRAHLEALKKEASAKGFALIAQKANEDLSLVELRLKTGLRP